MLEDGYRELSELLTPDGADNDSLNDDFGDEDGLMLDSAPLTTEEAERVNKVCIFTPVPVLSNSVIPRSKDTSV